jgi:hypothetical protein
MRMGAGMIVLALVNGDPRISKLPYKSLIIPKFRSG